MNFKKMVIEAVVLLTMSLVMALIFNALSPRKITLRLPEKQTADNGTGGRGERK